MSQEYQSERLQFIRQTDVGADLSRPLPIYRPFQHGREPHAVVHMSNQLVQMTDKSAVGAINRPLQRQASQPIVKSHQRVFQPKQAAQVATRWVPPHLYVLLSIISVQLGAAFAKDLFPVLGSTGTVFLRLSFAAIVLWCVWRPRLRSYTRHDYLLIVIFGLTIAAMNSFYYASIARIPLGIASTLEFVGPLGISIVASRRLPDVLWALFAAAGVILLAPIHGSVMNPLGILFALLAAACWALYILLSVRVGQVFHGGTALAIGMTISAIVLAPVGLPSLHPVMQNPSLLLFGFILAILSSVIPFSLELEALRRLSPRVLGILLSMEPVVAALIGFVVLGETVGLRGLIAMVLIVIASGGASFGDKGNNHIKSDPA